MKSKGFFTLLLGFTLFGLPAAHSIDIPLLTWEQGKSQSVVLGGPTSSRDWRVDLVSQESEFRQSFLSSSVNANGYRVYTINLSKSLTPGSYVIETSGTRFQRTTVAQVVVVPLTVYEVTKAPLDLLLILILLALLLMSFSLFRHQNLREIAFKDYVAQLRSMVTGNLSPSSQHFNFSGIELQRVRLIEYLPTSIFKFLLLANSSYMYKRSKQAFIFLPILSSLLAGVLSLLSIQNSTTFSSTQNLIIVALILIGIFDLFSGLAITITFISISVIFQDNFGVDSLVKLAVISGIFTIPGLLVLAGAFYCKVDFKSIFSPLFWSVSGFGYVFWCHLLLKSFGWQFTMKGIEIFIGVIAIAAAILYKMSISTLFLKSDHDAQIDEERLKVIRVASPYSSLGLFILLFSIYFNWARDIKVAFLGAALWAFPILLLSIRLDLRNFNFLRFFNRNLAAEVLLVLASITGIFFGLQRVPWLIEDRANAILALSAIPVLVHSIYVLVVEPHPSSERVNS